MNIFIRAMREPTVNDWTTPRSLNSEVAEILRGRGFTDDIIETWTDSLIPGSAEHVAGLALAWNRAGIPAEDAIEYLQLLSGWTPDYAAPFQQAGYKPRHAHFVDVLVRFNHLEAEQDNLDDGEDSPSTLEAWLHAPFTPLWTSLCLAADLHTVAAALAAQAEADHDPLTKIRLQWKAASRGLNVLNFTFEPLWFQGGLGPLIEGDEPIPEGVDPTEGTDDDTRATS